MTSLASTTYTRALLTTSMCLLLLVPAAIGDYDLSWFTIDAGGAMWTTGGELQLSGTIAQPDAGPTLTGGGLSLTGGFWPIGAAVHRGDVDCDGLVNTFDIDPFVLALINPAAYQAQFPGCNILNADADCDGLINTFDIDSFVTCIVSGCPACP
jgi:hypothetical protein